MTAPMLIAIDATEIAAMREELRALRIPMNVTLPGAPELDEYDEQRKAAADRIEELEADRDNLSDKLELERALTDGAHRRAGKAEAKLAKAADALEGAWAEATAAAYGRARNVAGAWGGTTVANLIHNEIASLTPQSARDWLAAHDAKAYRRGQEDMRKRAAEVAYQWWDDDDSQELRDIIRAIPIKEKDDE